MKNKKNFLCYIFVFTFIFSLFLIPQKQNPKDIKHIKIAGQSIKVELAISPSELEKGLSGRAVLNKNEGMLFIFEQNGKYPFWMKGVNFPIDIVWIGEDQKIVYIKKDAKPENYPETYAPDADALYVLEVVAGFSVNNNLKEGDSVEFVY